LIIHTCCIIHRNKFVNRSGEFNQLQTLYDAPQGGLAIVYGRRRLGKTRLLKEFSRGIRHCYFMADRAGEPSLRRSLALAMLVESIF